MTGRQLPASDYDAIRAATRKLISTVGGPVAAAGVTRGDHQNISRYGSAHPDNAERFMPIDVVADLEAECEQPVLTSLLARMTGHMLVTVPQVSPSGSPLAAITAASLKETADVFVALGASLGDGRLSKAEAEAIAREIDEALAKLAALKLQVLAEAVE